MTASAGVLPANHSNTGHRAEIRVSRAKWYRLAWALVKLSEAGDGPRITHREARGIMHDHLRNGETPEEVEAYLRATFTTDPTGVTAVRNVSRERGSR